MAFIPVSQMVNNIGASQVLNFTAATLGKIFTPAQGSTLSGPTVTFTWTGTGVGGYWLDVGTAPFVGNISAGSVGAATSKLVSGLPMDGSTIYVTLYSNINGSYTDSNGNYYRNSILTSQAVKRLL